MAFSKLIPFDRPLIAIAAACLPGRAVTEMEASDRAQRAYDAGADSARAAADQQMVELRAEMAQLSDGVLGKLGTIEGQLLLQLRESLPGLALEIARRLLAGFEPPPEVIEKIWLEALDQLYPERENLELALCPRDAELVGQLNPDWRSRYPGLRIQADASLLPGDCLVRSRFGLTDARRESKLAAFEHGLNGG